MGGTLRVGGLLVWLAEWREREQDWGYAGFRRNIMLGDTMRTFSRWMPVAPVPERTLGAWLVLGILVSGGIYFVYLLPSLIFVFAGVGIVIWILAVLFNRNMRRMAAGRVNENICTFVRQFDNRKTDPWVLRAVYEELSRHSGVDGHLLPIRADDHCVEPHFKGEWEWEYSDNNLRIDSEYFDELAKTIAVRAGRSMEGVKQNPFYGKVETVRDLVGFLEHQPKLTNAQLAVHPASVE